MEAKVKWNVDDMNKTFGIAIKCENFFFICSHHEFHNPSVCIKNTLVYVANSSIHKMNNRTQVTMLCQLLFFTISFFIFNFWLSSFFSVWEDWRFLLEFLALTHSITPWILVNNLVFIVFVWPLFIHMLLLSKITKLLSMHMLDTTISC